MISSRSDVNSCLRALVGSHQVAVFARADWRGNTAPRETKQREDERFVGKSHMGRGVLEEDCVYPFERDHAGRMVL